MTSPHPTPPRILLALTERERNLFLTDIPDLNWPCHWIHPSDDELSEEGWHDRLEHWQPEIIISGWATPSLPFCWVTASNCSLRAICHVTGSVRNLVDREFIARGGIITNWGLSVSKQVAEHALLLALAALRNMNGWSEFITQNPTTRRMEDLHTKTLFDRSIGLHGFGAVARSLISLVKPFSEKIYCYSANVPFDYIKSFGVIPCESLEALFSNSEVLFECEALHPGTTETVDAKVFAKLPDDAIFVNVGRGGVVKDPALIDEASTGRIKIALDVVNGEPLTTGHPVLSISSAILSPHIGGPTHDRYPACGRFAWHNLDQILRGETPPGVISLAAYDRST